MQFYPQSKTGFAISESVAEALGLADEYVMWQKGYDHVEFCNAFGERFGVQPDNITHFQYTRGGYVQGLSGFDWDQTYVLFDDYNKGNDNWEPMKEKIEGDFGFTFENGTWSELG